MNRRDVRAALKWVRRAGFMAIITSDPLDPDQFQLVVYDPGEVKEVARLHSKEAVLKFLRAVRSFGRLPPGWTP